MDTKENISSRSQAMHGKIGSFVSERQKPPIQNISPAKKSLEVSRHEKEQSSRNDKTLHFYKRSHTRAEKENTSYCRSKCESRDSSSNNMSRRGDPFIPGRIFSQTPTNITTDSIARNKPSVDIKRPSISAAEENLSDIISGLRKDISGKELELLNLKNEKMRAEMQVEDCKRDIRVQAKEHEAIKSAIRDQRGLCKHCLNVLKPLVLIIRPIFLDRRN